MRILLRKNGISLVEAMMTTLIIAVAIGAFHTILNSSGMSLRTYESKITSQREARQSLLRMTKELREASGISITQDANSATLSFTREGSAISYQWANSGPSAYRLLRYEGVIPAVVASNISALSFTDNTDAVTVNVTASKTAYGGKTSSFNLVERIALR